MSGPEQTTVEKVVVVGGGLVGALQACLMAKKGYQVDLYEYRKDMRTQRHAAAGKSINLAMSVRGLDAMKEVGLGDHVAREYGIPMYARMIHNPDKTTYSVPYGNPDQCIYSVGRKYINGALLTAGDEYPNLRYHFGHKLTDIDVDQPTMTFWNGSDGIEEKVTADVVFGCDGAFSNVRKGLMKKPRFNYSQEYIPHAYLELSMSPINDGKDFAMPANYLHIWPRGQFMLIGLPNQDKSWTMTLFMPNSKFDKLTNGEELLHFFNEHFPDATELIGTEKLIGDFFATEPASLVSIKCSPYNWLDKVLIMGDAAHAMVPFYGQGMNCGMEDVVVLDELMVRHGGNRRKAFDEYTLYRNPDVEAMCDLAVYNYVEMRDLVAKNSFLVRKKLDNLLHRLFPRTWIPLYTSVTFSRMRYSRCVSNRKWQDETLATLCHRGGWICGFGATAVLAYFYVNNDELAGCTPATLTSIFGWTRAFCRRASN